MCRAYSGSSGDRLVMDDECRRVGDSACLVNNLSAVFVDARDGERREV